MQQSPIPVLEATISAALPSHMVGWFPHPSATHKQHHAHNQPCNSHALQARQQPHVRHTHVCPDRYAATDNCCVYLGPMWCSPPLWYMWEPPAGGLIMPTPLPVPAAWLLLPAAPRVRISDTADSTQRCRKQTPAARQQEQARRVNKQDVSTTPAATATLTRMLDSACCRCTHLARPAMWDAAAQR